MKQTRKKHSPAVKARANHERTEVVASVAYDTDVVMTDAGEGMRHLIAEAGIDHVVLGTDYPFPWNNAPVDHVMSIPGLSDEDRIKILGGTAAKLLGIEG